MCPEIVKDYSEAMASVDLADMPVSLYRTNIKSKRWYLKIIFHCIDICKVNGWLLYRRFADQTNLPKKKQNKLLKFTIDIGSFQLNSIYARHHAISDFSDFWNTSLN